MYRLTLVDGMEKVVCIPQAKVRIVKVWDPVLKLACDMNVNNTLALENTRMIKTYIQIDERVRPLAMIIKYWTKQRLLNDAGKHFGVHFSILSNIQCSHRWHDKLLHMDLHDSELPPNAGPAHITRASQPSI